MGRERQPPPVRPFTAGALRRLGQNLAEGGDLTGQNEPTFDAYLRHYGELSQYLRSRILTEMAHSPIRALAMDVTSRPKSLLTTIDKVRRGMPMDSIRDLVGARVVVHGGGRMTQDRVVAVLAEAFDCSKRPIDRRTDPRSGYRAVHLEVRLGTCRAEIQVRTALQHEWAEVSEFAADRWGRELRYEGIPPNFTPERAQAWSLVLRAADNIDAFETMAHQLASLGMARRLRLVAGHPLMVIRFLRVEAKTRGVLKALRRVVDSLTEHQTPSGGTVPS